MYLMLCKNIFLQSIKCILSLSNILVCFALRCQNAFDAKMHLMPKCILAYIFQRKMFSVHFPKENVQQRCAKMHLMQKCIFAYILRSKMFSITFYEVKCSASHFPLENVQHQQNVQHHIFQRKIFSNAIVQSTHGALYDCV